MVSKPKFAMKPPAASAKKMYSGSRQFENDIDSS
jgi:hypothetical protein